MPKLVSPGGEPVALGCFTPAHAARRAPYAERAFDLRHERYVGQVSTAHEAKLLLRMTPPFVRRIGVSECRAWRRTCVFDGAQGAPPAKLSKLGVCVVLTVSAGDTIAVPARVEVPATSPTCGGDVGLGAHPVTSRSKKRHY